MCQGSIYHILSLLVAQVLRVIDVGKCLEERRYMYDVGKMECIENERNDSTRDTNRTSTAARSVVTPNKRIPFRRCFLEFASSVAALNSPSPLFGNSSVKHSDRIREFVKN